MKKIVTAFAIIALIGTLSTWAFGQTGKRNMRGKAAGFLTTGPIGPTYTPARGSSAGLLGSTFGRDSHGRRVIMANTEGDFHFAGPLDHSQINGNLKTSGARQRSNAMEGDPDQPIVIPAKAWRQRRNQAGFLTTNPQGPTYTPARSRRYLEQDGFHK